MNKLPMLAALLATTALFMPHVGTNAGGKVYVCATPQNAALDLAGYQALAWVEIDGIGEVGEMGTTTNILTYDQWNTDVVDKGKGMSNAGDPTVEAARIPADPGQQIMRAIALQPHKYAFKIVKNDPAILGGAGTTIYTRGLVTGPARPMGRNEDFDLEIYTLGLVQREIVVDPVTGNAPYNTVLPAVTGTAQVTEILTASNGTWSGDATIVYAHQWRRNGVAIVGATSPTYVVVAADVGKVLSCVVTASNDAGAASAVSAPTAAVIA